MSDKKKDSPFAGTTVFAHNLIEVEDNGVVDPTFLTVEAKFALTLISVEFLDPPKAKENIFFFLESEKMPNEGKV